MSATAEIEQTTDEPQIVRRTFAADLTPGDGRTVDVKIVPYGEQIEHDDGLGGVPIGIPYVEEWTQGTFKHQLKAANRVLANGEHQEGIAGIVGHGVALRESSDGLYGSFRIHETPDGDKALVLIREGVWDGVSLEARLSRSQRTPTGVIRRVKAHLEAIAFTRKGAFESARVLAVREAAILEDEPEPIPDELLPVDIDPALVERVRSLGLHLPERYAATPATDTPDDDTAGDGDESDTSTGAPRQDD